MGNEASEEIPTEPSPAVALKIAKSCENMSTVCYVTLCNNADITTYDLIVILPPT